MIIPPFTIAKGHKADPSAGTCAMAAVSWLMHGVHSDEPECACPVIRAFIIPANDAMDDATRQRFIPFLHRIAGSRSPEHEDARARVMWLAAVRVFAPMALDAAGLTKKAAWLRGLADDVSAANAANAAACAAADAANAANAAACAAADAANAANAAYAAACAAYAAACAAYAAACAADAAACAADVWDAYFATLDEVLRAGPEGDPWSATQCEIGARAYAEACG